MRQQCSLEKRSGFTDMDCIQFERTESSHLQIVACIDSLHSMQELHVERACEDGEVCGLALAFLIEVKILPVAT